jgi:predicted ribosome quality control (RQC) complex YloA/Tae2 family protein
MDDESIKLIVDELAQRLVGRAPGKIFQLGEMSFAIDFGLRDLGYLFLSAEPAAPRLYLIKRRVRELEKLSAPLKQFGLTLKKQLEQTRLRSIAKDVEDRIVRFVFAGQDDVGTSKTRILVAQLTGRSANLLLLDEQNKMIQLLRSSEKSLRIGELYRTSSSPTKKTAQESDLLIAILSRKFLSASEAADDYFTTMSAAREKAERIASARAELRRKISRQQKLLQRLERDLRLHQNPQQYKRIGDLLLANLSTAKRHSDRVTLIDYFSEGAPTIEIEIDDNTTLQEEAARRFAFYAKSKRAVQQINSRLEIAKAQLGELESAQQSLEATGNLVGFESPATIEQRTKAAAAKESNRIKGARRYVSSDGFEILVGRTAQDNDRLTFKVAQPNDLWLHAADCGGSHVVVRNSTRKEFPQRTLIEAAQLAAYFSQAKKDPKVDVHYTQRKFVSKIKGAKPGLVRLQRFKNITVQPTEAVSRI